MSDLEVEPAVETEPAAAQPDEGSVEPAEEVWGGPSQEDWQTTQDALAYMANVLAPPQPQYQQQPEAPTLPDWIDDDDQARIDAYIEAKMAPISSYTQQAIMGEAEEKALDILHDITTREGEFLHEGSVEKARALANSYVPQMAAQYGAGPAAAEHALEQAYKDVREWEDAVGKAYHDRQINQLSTLGGARQEPGAAGSGGAQQFVIPTGGSLVDVAYRHGGGAR